MTNEEAYKSFKENCREPVRALMEEHVKKILAKVSKRPESADKDYRIELARDRIPDRFPSMSWFLEQRPPEVKACSDHATGLCKVRQPLFYQPQLKCNYLDILVTVISTYFVRFVNLRGSTLIPIGRQSRVLASAKQRSVQPGIAGVMMWTRMRRWVATVGVPPAIAMCAAVAM